jgi:quinol-cytochrome oxidoreductase complex cytochrome b subunit
MIILILIILHINLLHKENSTNSLGLNKKIDLINLFIIHVIKDLLILSGTLLILINLILIKPEFFSTADRFILINYFVTPQHIQPE